MTNKIKLKKNNTVSKDEESTFSFVKIKDFFSEVKVEFTKIVWPERKVTLGLTGVVVVLTIVIAVYLGSVDLLLGKLVASFLQ